MKIKKTGAGRGIKPEKVGNIVDTSKNKEGIIDVPEIELKEIKKMGGNILIYSILRKKGIISSPVEFEKLCEKWRVVNMLIKINKEKLEEILKTNKIKTLEELINFYKKNRRARKMTIGR